MFGEHEIPKLLSRGNVDRIRHKLPSAMISVDEMGNLVIDFDGLLAAFETHGR